MLKFIKNKDMKSTKIVATIGPASSSEEMLKKISDAGVNVFRFNFSHGTHEDHGLKMDRIRKLNLPGAILLDTKGPEIRTGEFKDGLSVKVGDKFTTTIEKGIYEDTKKVSINYKEFIKDVEVGDTIVIDSGAIFAKALSKTKTDIVFEVTEGSGKLTTKRHINLQGKDVSLPTITENDWLDIKFGCEQKVDFIALSFVRTAKDIQDVRDFCAKNGHGTVQIISKIECSEAVKNLDELVEASDGIMVARGDLACEVSFALIPTLQKEMIELCKFYKKPIIIATQMLLSMVDNVSPTRAEVSDVANAIFDYSDAVMLSDESTKSQDPSHVVKTMARIALETEEAMEMNGKYTEPSEVISLLGDLANEAEAIVIISDSDELAREVSNARLDIKTFAFVENQLLNNCMHLLFGVLPYKIKFEKDIESTLKIAEKEVKKFDDQIESYIAIFEKNVNGKKVTAIEFRSL